MCLIIFAYQTESEFPLVLAANRDEFYSRPSRQAQFWVDTPYPQILAGRDLVAGGTWLGLSQSGRFAAVTNIRDPSKVEVKARSRGELTLNFLSGKQSPQQYADSLLSNFDDFAGYNLLIGDTETLLYVNNQEQKICKLEPGIYGMSNGLLDTDWPKVVKGRQQLQQLVQSPSGFGTDDLIEMMNCRNQAPETKLPATGVSTELERVLSSAFIQNPERKYGTLCSTALLVGKDGNYQFSEQNYDESGARTERHHYEWKNPLAVID